MVGTTILFIYGLISFYTIILLRYCLDSEFDLKTYPDSAQAAFLPRDIILYLEQYTSIFSIHPINDFSLYFLNSVCQEKVHNYRIPSGVKTHNR
ncbi:unnamed protein product, partial [Brassica rapa]